MFTAIRGAGLPVCAALVVFTIGCGGSPAAPAPAAQAAFTGATSPDPVSPSGAQGAAAKPANLNGPVSQANPGARTFVVDNTVVRVSDATSIVSNEGTALSFDDVIDGSTVHVKGTLDGAIVAAASVNVREVNLSGTVTDVTGACPGLSFSLGGRNVVTDGETSFGPGDCADLAGGVEVEVRGAYAAGVLTAARVELPRVDRKTHVTIAGTIGTLGGACPDRTFTLGTASVVVGASTEYARGTCTDLADGTSVEIKGERGEDGIVAASVVAFDNPHQPEKTPPAPPSPAPTPGPTPPPAPAPKDVRIEGPASSVTGACPALAFTVSGKRVTTDASTKFIGSGHCGLIVDGKSVEVTGPEVAGAIAATRVKVSK